jgi:hypothetical protein
MERVSRTAFQGNKTNSQGSRTAFQGITNIIRFNWHFYAIALFTIAALIIVISFLPVGITPLAKVAIGAIAISTVTSLAVSYYIYDYSGLYSFHWLDAAHIRPNGHMLNINAGFDETSWILKDKFPDCTLTVLDFYDPVRHTEISIKRARKAYPPYPGTKLISTSEIALPAGSTDHIFLLFAAHEIRDQQERIVFFRQLKEILAPDGQIIIMEHLRDKYNFFAYNIGYLHFFKKSSWRYTFKEAGLSGPEEIRINPFVSIFFLNKDGSTT